MLEDIFHVSLFCLCLFTDAVERGGRVNVSDKDEIWWLVVQESQIR